MSANSRLPRSCRGILLTLLLPAAFTAGRPANGFSQQLILSAEVNKTQFFEDEPIYLLVRLQNVGTDTAWTYFFSLLSPSVALYVSRAHGKPVEVAKPVVDHIVRPSWRGEAVLPGACLPQTMVLQDIMGDEQDIRSHLFAPLLAPEEHELRLTFLAHGARSPTRPPSRNASPLLFLVTTP